MTTQRGADVVARTLSAGGVTRIFSLSGNHIMPLYDAALDVGLPITHTRHEGAAVHMADAWGRLTGVPGIALLTGGPGHANGVGALHTALASESPLVMLSGHAPLRELGMGSFQEMRQADMAAPVVKASWTAQSAETLADDVARALRIATSGRPGPVHLSIPVDLLENPAASRVPGSESFRAKPQALEASTADALTELIRRAQRPLVLVGPTLSDTRAGTLRRQLADALGVAVIAMESPRGLNDPALGALAKVVARADAIVLLGKQLDFTLKFAAPPAVDASCRFAVVDPDATAIEHARKVLGNERIALTARADSRAAAQQLARVNRAQDFGWTKEVEAALAVRADVPAAAPDDALHPVQIGRAVQALIDASPHAIFISDGGEFGQWAQACVSASTRLINGQSGSIGSAVPFAVAAKLVRPDAPVVALTGDGACGFHLMELDTAIRARLPLVVVVGNDACWNAEYQIQLRAYGKTRAHGCELLPTRYDQVAAALGAHGELVEREADLESALRRAIACGRPALVNVMMQRAAAPTIR